MTMQFIIIILYIYIHIIYFGKLGNFRKIYLF